MPNRLRKIIKALGVGAAGLVIVAALGVGAFRIVVAALPSYQEPLRSLAEEALGLAVQFSRLDARWGLRGPELSFYDASVMRPDGDGSEPIISAAEVTLGLSPLALVLEQRFALNRLVLDQTQLTVETDGDGGIRLQGVPAGGATGDLRLRDLPDVEVLLTDSTIRYLDPRDSLAWTFDDVRVRLERAEDGILLEARGQPPETLGRRVDISIDAVLGTAVGSAPSEWLVVTDLEDIDFAAIAAAFPDSSGLPVAGVGDLSLWLELAGTELRQATAQVELADLKLAGQAADDAGYDELEFTAEWQRSTSDWRLTLSNLIVARDGRRWPLIASVELGVDGPFDALASFQLDSNFLRLEDLEPLLVSLPEQRALTLWRSLAPRGDLTNVALRAEQAFDTLDYAATLEFDDLSVASYDGLPNLAGLSGAIRADSRSGSLELTTRDGVLDWPGMFRETLEIGELTGILVWRHGRDGVRFVSDNLTLNNRDAQTRSSLELIVPTDGSAPRLDLETQVYGFDTTRTPGYLPVAKLPPPVVAWLDRSIVRGRVPEAEVAFFGPVDAFPFDNGEGQFRARFSVEDGALAYVDSWPIAEEISGEVEFVNAGFTARGTGRIMQRDRAEMLGGVADMRDAVLTVDGDVGLELGELLDFLRTVPVTAQRLGPDLSRLQSSAGDGRLTFDLSLPLDDIGSYALDAELTMDAGELSVDGFDLVASDIAGSLRLGDNVVTGSGITATLLGSPVVASVAPSPDPDYRAVIAVDGTMEAGVLDTELNLPFATRLDGTAQWQGSLLLPVNIAAEVGATRAPLRIAVSSNLVGVDSSLPAPLDKRPSQAMPLDLELTVLPQDRFDVEGRLGTSQRFALSFWNTASGPQFRRGAIRLDGSYPLLPPDDGLDIEGAVRRLSVDSWLALLREQNLMNRNDPVLTRVDVDVADFTVLGQDVGAATLAVRQGRDQWLIELDSEPIAGHVVVPFRIRDRPQIIADMQRLQLTMGGDPQTLDPRTLPGLLINAVDFSVGQRRLGRLSANVQADPLGLRLVSYASVNESFVVEGGGSWLAGVDGSMTRFAFSMLSEDVGATLADLGLQPIVEADGLEVTGSVSWPGGPSSRWQENVSGDLSLRVDQGSMINLEPGAGRMWGLLSFSALPRRLALDFRDVFNRGLVFDEVAGDFLIVDGNAYTDNLLLTGPVADIGVVGRTGLRNEDYQQQAVVTAEPGKVLPTMGFLAGPGVGAALLLFTQIFKEPLKGIGRASYCVSGDWEAPVVERLTPEQIEAGYLCADLPPSAATVADATP
jgi:uncharacterized protein (TIGR02099 family)